MWCNQIFSLIKPQDIDINGVVVNEHIIQNIIVCDNYDTANQIAKLQFGDTSYAMDTTQYPLSIGNVFRNDGFYSLAYEDDFGNVFEEEYIPRNLTIDEEVALLKVENSNLKEQINPTINYQTCTLDELKLWQINLSKSDLNTYFNTNTIISSCHGGIEKQYSITLEKQTLLTQMILMSQLATQANIPYQPSWNASGEACTYDWTIEELQQLAFEIEQIVRPKISHQQTIEMEIKECETKEEVLDINILII